MWQWRAIEIVDLFLQAEELDLLKQEALCNLDYLYAKVKATGLDT